MKKLAMTMMIAMMSLLLLGCSTKTEYVYIKPKPFKFQKVPPPKVREIRVYKKDRKLYVKYIEQFRKSIDFCNKQIDDYYKSFEEQNK